MIPELSAIQERALSLSSEALWQLEAFRIRGRGREFSQPDLDRARTTVRRLLQRAPQWYFGHIELGLIELRAFFGGFDGPATRTARTVALCARSGLEAVQAATGRAPLVRGKTDLYLRFLNAMSSYLERDFTRATDLFAPLVAHNNSIRLRPEMRAQVAEYGGIASFIAQDYKLAKTFLTAIDRSLLGREALDVLERLERES